MATKRIARRALLPLVGAIIAVAVWEATVLGYQLPAIVLPSPKAVVAALRELFFTRAFWRDVGGVPRAYRRPMGRPRMATISSTAMMLSGLAAVLMPVKVSEVRLARSGEAPWPEIRYLIWDEPFTERALEAVGGLLAARVARR